MLAAKGVRLQFFLQIKIVTKLTKPQHLKKITAKKVNKLFTHLLPSSW